MTTRSASKSKSRLKPYLIGRPVTDPCSLTGRCTKGFVGYDLKAKRLCFIKDFWRPLAEGMHPEWEVYKRLKENGVLRYVATALAGGDVRGESAPQHTITQDYLNDQSVTRSHGRLVTKEVGRSLRTYRDSAQLMYATYHALLGTLSAISLQLFSFSELSYRPSERMGVRRSPPPRCQYWKYHDQCRVSAWEY